MNTRCYVFGVFLTLYIAYNDAKYFKFTNFVCENFNKSWITINECRLRALNRNKTVLNFNATYHHPVNDIRIDVQTFKKANGYKPWLYKFSLDGCQFMRKPYNPIAILLFKTARQFSNINHTCPYVGPIIIKEFFVKFEFIVLPFPSGDYLVTLLWMFGKKPQYSTNVYVTYSED